MIRNQISKVFEYKQCRVVRPSKACLLWNMSHPSVLRFLGDQSKKSWTILTHHEGHAGIPNFKTTCVCLTSAWFPIQTTKFFSTTSALPPIGFPFSFSSVLLFVVSWKGKSLSNTFHGVLRQFMATLTRRRNSLNNVLGYALKWHGK